MPGLYGFYHKNRSIPKNQFQYFFKDDNLEVSQGEKSFNEFKYGRSVISKFSSDRIFHEDNHLIIGTDGYFLGIENPTEHFNKSYKSKGIDFVSSLRGVFSGFLYDKRKEFLFLFTDTFATRSLYYYFNKEKQEFFFSSELAVLTKFLHQQKIPVQADPEAFYCMLSLGYMLDDITYAKDIKRLRHSSILKVNLKSININQYQYFNFNQPTNDISLNEAIENVDPLIQKAVNEEWEKDKTETDISLAFLSGGLDSRVNVLTAFNQNFKSFKCLNFSQTGTYDHTIAREIAMDLSIPYHFYPLDNGHYFMDEIKNLIKANDGMVSVIGSSHMFQALKSLSLSDFGLAHSGQLGDVLFGSFVRPDLNLRKHIGKLGSINDSKILSKINRLPAIIQKYEDNIELYSFEQRQVNGTLNGDRMCSHLIDISSPFYNRELLQFCLALPDHLKKNQNLYKQWIRVKHPEIMSYRWDKAGIVPKHKWITEIAIQFQRIKRKINQLKGHDSESMNPFDLWIRENGKLNSQVYQMYNIESESIDENWLSDTANHVFENHGARGKFAAITALVSFNIHIKNR